MGSGPFMDSSGLELIEATGPIPSGMEGGRLIVGHNLPRLIVMGGVEEWTASSVCHRSCLKNMEEDSIKVLKVGVFIGSRGTRARLGMASEEGKEVGEDIINTDLVKGSYVEKQVDRNIGPDNDLWLDCVYNTLDMNTTIFGGVGAGLEHCFGVLTYLTKSVITSCKSHPTEYSVLYALDIYLENEDYNTYNEDYYVEEAFDSEEEENYDDAFGKRKKRKVTTLRKKREAYELLEDNLFDKLSDDKSSVRDRIKSLQANSSTAAMINSLLAKDSQYAAFCRTELSEMPVIEVKPPMSKALGSVSAVPRLNTESNAVSQRFSPPMFFGMCFLGIFIAN